MKRFFFFYLLIMLCSLILYVSNSFAWGLGVAYNAGSGSGEFDPDSNFYDGNLSYDRDDSSAIDVDTSYSSLGLVLDSNVSREDVFNYRLDLQYGTFTYKFKDRGDLDLDQFTMDHTFGFRLYRNDLVRIWMGPQIRLSYAYADGDDQYGIDYSQFGFGIAPVLGVNFNPGKVVSPALTIGYRFHTIYGARSGGERVNNIDDNYFSTDYGPFLSLSLLFRLNE